MFKCEQCGKVCKTERGLSIHKSYHTETQPVSEIGEVDNTMPNSIDQAIGVLEQQRKKRMLTALEENNLLTIKLENKRMNDELTGNTPAQTQPEQRSELDTFSKFVEMQEKMAGSLATREENLKNRIREEIENSAGTPEDSMETRLAFEALGLLKAKMAAGQLPAAQTTLPTTSEIASAITPPIKKNMKTEEEIIQEKIRSGEMKFPEAKKLFKKKYPQIKMTDSKLKKEFEKIKNG